MPLLHHVINHAHLLPRFWRLATTLWLTARALPSEAAIRAAGEDDSWNDFFSRVLPQPGSGSYINNEDYPEQLFDVSASDAARAASLRALGWPEGRLPGKTVLIEHMLTRVEFEYAEHLYDHSLEPGEWCDVCQCICARVGDDDSESDPEDDDNCVDPLCEDDPAQDMDDWSFLWEGSETDDDDFCCPSGSAEAAA